MNTILGSKGSAMVGGGVVVPWEHWVCTQCLQDNPYAVWLIKLKCFQPRHRDHNYPIRKVLVSIDPSAMKLVKMRQHPASIEGRSESLSICQSLPYCQRGNNCPFPHSQVEFETWEFIRTLFKGKYKANASYWCMHIHTVSYRTSLYL